MWVPVRWAAAMTSSPGLASMARPSIVTVTVVFFGASGGVSDTGDLRRIDDRAPVLDVVLELVPEQLEGRRQRRRGRRAEHADRGLPGRPGQAGTDVVGHVQQEVEVARPAVAVDDPLEHPLQPRCAFTARGALAAALAGEEADDAPARLHHVGGVVHDDDGAGAEHRAGPVDGGLVEREVDLLLGEPGRRGAAEDERLEPVTG